MTTVASTVPFHNLCVILDRVVKTSGSDAKKRILKEFIDEWRACHNKIHKDDPNTTDSFFPAMRLLLPQLERDREAYGIKEHMLAKLYIEILGLGKDSPSAQKLLNFRAPKNARGDAGDFAAVAFYVLKPRCPEKGTLTLEDINRSLNKVASCNTAKDKEGVRKALRFMLQNTSAREQKWLIRMILKEMKMGISQQSVFSIFHEDAEDLYNVKMSLDKVCTMLRDPKVRLHEVEISVFSPFRPMLGDRGNPNQVEKLFDNKPFIIETKFDGERMQLHKDGDQFKYFSRSGNDYTHIFGANPFEGNLTPFMANCFKENVNKCILDGEMVAYDPNTDTIGYKGQNMDMKAIRSDDFQPLLCVFDVLLVNDEVMSNKPLRERKKKLEEVFTPIPERVRRSEYREASTKQECVDALNESIEQREEGLMVKDPESPYRPNMRKGGWYKMKPEYIGGLMDELDVLVVGGFMGVGHRSNMMSHFLCALAVPPESGGKPTEFHTFCKVGSGYSRKELYDFNASLVSHWKPFSKKNPPGWLHFASGFKQKPDACIEPSKSRILQIKAAEITESDQYKTGYTLRFPRVEKIRDDKPWYECMTTTEVEDMRKQADGKLTGRLAEVDGDEDEPKKKRRKVATRYVKPTVMAQFKGVDTSTVTKVSELFANKEICVINGPAAHSKADLEQKVIQYGGTIVQNPGPDTYCVIAEKLALRVKNIISKGEYDVVKAQWLLKSIDAKSCLQWEPNDMLHVSPQTAQSLAKDYDEHGDSYYDDTNVEALKNVFKKIEEDNSSTPLDVEDIAEIEMNYFPQDSVYGLFRLCKVYMDDKKVIGSSSTHIVGSSLELVSLELRFHGATVTDTISQDTSHIIVHSSDTSRVKELQESNKKRSRKFHIVTENWVSDSIEQNKLAPERGYLP